MSFIFIPPPPPITQGMDDQCDNLARELTDLLQTHRISNRKILLKRKHYLKFKNRVMLRLADQVLLKHCTNSNLYCKWICITLFIVDIQNY